MWDVATGVKRARVIPSPGRVSLALSPDGTRLATVSECGDVRVVALSSGEVLFHRDDGMGLLAWSPDGRLLAVHLNKPGLVVMNAADFAPRARLVLEQANQVSQVSFAADGSELTAFQWQVGICAWNLASGERRVIAHGAFTGAAPAADGRWLVTHDRGAAPPTADGIAVLGIARKLCWGRRSGQLALLQGPAIRWRDEDGALLCELRSSDTLALHPDGNLLAVGRGDRVELRDRSGALVRELSGFREPPGDVVVSSDGRHVLALRSEPPRTGAASVFLYDVATRASSAVQVERVPIRLLTVPGQPDVLFADTGWLQLWHPQTRAVTRGFDVPRLGVWPVWSPDGRLVWPGGVFGRGGETTSVFDLDTSRWQDIPTPGGAKPLAWSRDRRRLLLWRFSTSHAGLPSPLFLTIDGVAAATASVGGALWTASWSPCGDLVAVATTVGTVVLDGMTLAERAHGPRSRWVRFIDEQHVVTGADNRLLVWRGDTGEVVCSEVLRDGADRTSWTWYDAGTQAGDASADGRTIAVADELGVHVFAFER